MGTHIGKSGPYTRSSRVETRLLRNVRQGSDVEISRYFGVPAPAVVALVATAITSSWITAVPTITPGGGGGTTLNLQAGASSDDSHQQSIPSDAGRNVTGGGTCSLTATILSPGSHSAGDEWSVAAAFTLNVAQGETITEAIFSLRANATYSAGSNVIKLYASVQDSDAPGALTSGGGDLNAAARPRTTATTVLDVTSVTGGTWYEWDITAAVQELVDRAGWVSGNRCVVLVDTHEDTTTNEWQDFDSYDGAPVGAPKLDVTYGSGGGSAVDLVATAISHSLAFGVVPVARALRAAAIGLSLASDATRVARDLKAAAVSASRASDVTVVGRTLRASGISLTSARAPLPVARMLTASALDADQALAVSLVARALRASGLSIDSATGALPVGRGLSAAALSGSVVVSVLPVGRGLRASAIDFDLAVLLALDISGVLPVLLVATAISYSRAFAVVPVSRALLATEVSQSLAGGAVPVARVLAARSISSGRASGVSVALRALRASALSLSPAASASRSLRNLRAAGLSLGRAVAALPVARPLTARAVSLSRAGSAIPIARGLRASSLSGSRGLAALPIARGLRASALSLGRANGSAHVARLLRASALSPDLAAAVAPVARALEAHAIGFDLALLGDLIVISGESWIVPICRVTLLSPSATVEQLLPIGRVSLEDLPTAELSLALAPVANVDHAEPGALITLEDLPLGTVGLQSPGATVTHEDPIATITRRTS